MDCPSLKWCAQGPFDCLSRLLVGRGSFLLTLYPSILCRQENVNKKSKEACSLSPVARRKCAAGRFGGGNHEAHEEYKGHEEERNGGGMADRIKLRGIQFYGYHGVPDAEQETGHRYEVDLVLEV